MSVIAGIDIETTGLDQASGHRIIEISVAVYEATSPTKYRQVGKWTQRVNPLREIDKGAQNVHGISLFDLKSEPEWPEVAPKLQAILKLCDLAVAHNAAFDMPFIAHEIMRIGLELPPFDVYCTMENGRNTTPFGKLPNLGEFCFAYGVNYEPAKAHAAEYDVEVMMKAFFNGLASGHIQIEGLFPVAASI